MKKREIKVIPYKSALKNLGYIDLLPAVQINYSRWQDDKGIQKGLYRLVFGFLIFRVTIDLRTWNER